MIDMVLSGLLSILIWLLGTFAGYYWASRKERRNELHQMRLKAYDDFVKAVSRFSLYKRRKEQYNQAEIFDSLNDAKCRMILYADVKVVEALSDFWRKGCSLETELEILSFRNFCIQSRNSLKLIGDKENDIHKPDVFLSDILFQLEPSSSPILTHSKNILCASPVAPPEAAA